MPTDLSQSIHLLGNLLGEVITEQESREIFEIEERIRLSAKARRSGDQFAADNLTSQVAALNPKSARAVATAFTVYFDLVNLAEDNHRVFRLRERSAKTHPQPIPDSVGAAIHKLKAEGVKEEDLAALLDNLDIELVLTAHPTEAKRRTMLSKSRHVAELLYIYHLEDLLPRHREDIHTALQAEITNIWLTSRARTTRPLVTDEVKTTLYFIDEVLWDVLPEIYNDLDRAIATYYPNLRERYPISNHQSWLRLASWVGGDRDGNPNVTPEITADTLRMHRGLAITKHIETLRPLARRLSLTESRVPPPEELKLWIKERSALSEHVAFLENRYPNEPYRLVLAALLTDLEKASQEKVKEILLTDEEVETSINLESVTTPFNLVMESVPKLIAEDHLKKVHHQLQIFGLYAARLDIREDANVLASTLEEILAALNLEKNFCQLEKADRAKLLIKLLQADPPNLAPHPGVTPRTSKTYHLFQLLSRVRNIYGQKTLGPFIISMADSAADVLTVLLLARWSGCDEGLHIVPLFETVNDLHNAPDTLVELFTNPVYKNHLAACQQKQMVMIGYSDSNKDGGYLAANWALYQAQEKIAGVCKRHGVKLCLFHGRGGTVARGGGPANRAIRAQPKGTVQGRFRVTEQGETIAARYLNAHLAHRHLEQLVNAVILTSSPSQRKEVVDKKWRVIMDDMSAVAKQTYRDLVYETPEFLTFWRNATPLDQISRLRIGSRPTSRPGAQEKSDLDKEESATEVVKIRAIPWVFSWMQSRYNLPSWYGLGTGLNSGEPLSLLKEMYQEWSFFQALVDNTEMSLLKADMSIAALYAELVPDQAIAKAIFDRIREEYQRTCAAVLAITGHDALMDADPTIQRSIHLRNPYVDPLNYIQVEMLRRLRSMDDQESKQASELREVIVLTINGIAAGLRNTG